LRIGDVLVFRERVQVYPWYNPRPLYPVLILPQQTGPKRHLTSRLCCYVSLFA